MGGSEGKRGKVGSEVRREGFEEGEKESRESHTQSQPHTHT